MEMTAHPTFKFIDLFAGIGGFAAALEALGGESVYSVEIDPAAAQPLAREQRNQRFAQIGLAVAARVVSNTDLDERRAGPYGTREQLGADERAAVVALQHFFESGPHRGRGLLRLLLVPLWNNQLSRH